MQRAEAANLVPHAIATWLAAQNLFARSKLANDAACNRLHTAAMQRAADLVLGPA